MAGSYTSTGTYSNLTRLELEQLRKADFFAGSKALTIGDSGLPPEGVVGPGNINAEPYLTGPNVLLNDVYSVTPPTQPGPGLETLTQIGISQSGRYLAGIFELTNSSASVTTTVSQVGTLSFGNLISFVAQPGVPYVVQTVSGGSITLATPYTGTTGNSIGTEVSETVNWFGPTDIAAGSNGTATGAAQWTDGTVNFTTEGVLAGDILLVKTNGSNPNAVATISVVASTVLTLTNVNNATGGTTLTVSATLTSYVIVRPNALQLFAVPGSGPTGSEQTFLAVNPVALPGSVGVTGGLGTVTTTNDLTQAPQLVLPGSSISFGSQPGVFYTVQSLTSSVITLVGTYGGTTAAITSATVSLHNTVAPTVDQVNAGRIKNLVPSQYALNSTVDRADAVFDAPGPRLSLNLLGYRVVLYPDNGSGTGPNLSTPIATLSPVIDPTIPSTDQRFTIDYKAGDIRFSCAPKTGGQIKVAGGTNATTGRLNLYAVFWAVDQTATKGAATSLYGLQSTNNTLLPPNTISYNPPTNSWYIGGVSLSDLITLRAVANWGEESTLSSVNFDSNGSLSGPFAMAWNDISREWCIAGYYTLFGNIAVYMNNGTDSVMTILGGVFSYGTPPSTICVDSSGGVWVGAFNDATGFATSWTSTGGAFSAPVNFGSSGTWSDYKLTAIGTVIVGAVGNTSSGVSQLLHVTSGSVTSIMSIGGIVVSAWILKSNGVTAVALPKLHAVANIYTTTTGTSWTTTNISAQVAGLPVTIAWNPVKKLWLLVSIAGPDTFIYTSPNALTWSLMVTLTAATTTILEVVALQGVWVAANGDLNDANSQICYSVDAVNWYLTTVKQITNVDTSNVILVASDTTLAFSGGCFAPSQSNNLRFSKATAFSDTTLT